MKLSEVIDDLMGELVCDGTFHTLEYCTSHLEVPFLTFMENPKFIDKISPFARCILCKKEMVKMMPQNVEGIFVTDTPKEMFHLVHNKLCGNITYSKMLSTNSYGNGCIISESAHIAKEGVIIGNNVVIEDNVTIYSNVSIGDDCIIHSGAVIGGKAFTFARASGSRIIGLQDVGKVVIGDRVEIFPQVHIAKGILPTDITCIGDDVKIDALVYVGHGVHVGARTLIAAGALIGGNTKIGCDSWIGVNATLSNRLVVGNRVRVSLGAVVTKDVMDNQTVTGNFAVEHKVFLENLKKSIKSETE